jgi:hypothetical protein
MKRGIYAAIIVSIVGAGAWLLRHAKDKKADQEISSTALPANDQVKVIGNPKHGTVTVVSRDASGTRTSTSTVYVGKRPYAVDVTRAGGVTVSSRKYGTELSPFVGVALGSDVSLRGAVGLNLFYIQRWEVGGGLLLDSNIKDTRMFAHVAYNVYDGIDLSVGVDNRHTAHLLASLKF